MRSTVPTVAYIGRLSPEKGLPFLLQAWPRISHEARLLVIGEQHGREPLLERQVPGVELLGPRNGQELYRIVNTVDVVVVPSLSPDNAPNVVLEALALGKLVVATTVGGIPDQVDYGCAILVAPWDVPALSVALDRLLADDRLRERMGERGRSHVISLFRPELHISRLLGIFERCLAARSK